MMKHKLSKLSLFLTVSATAAVALPVTQSRGSDLSVTGNISATGTIDIKGPSFTLGSWAADSSKFGLSTVYFEYDADESSVTYTQSKVNGTWLWQKAYVESPGDSVPQMRLDPDGSLSLFDGDNDPNQPAIHFAARPDPDDGSWVSGSLYIFGTDNEMPYQTLAGGSNCVLTLGLADARYVLRGTGSTLALGYLSAASGTNSTAVGAASSASGSYSTALSYGALASGQYTVALGNGSQALGATSTAVGTNSAASGDNSITLGNTSLSSGWGSVTVGIGSHASGAASAALGAYSASEGDLSITLGASSSASAHGASA